MLMYVYIFALIVGGVLLGSSILLGGKDADADGDGGHDADHDADAGEADAGDHDDLAADKGGIDKGGLDAGGLDLLWPLRSVRFWTFFLAFFGLTGLVLDGLGLAGRLFALAAAVAMGLATGLGAAWLIRLLAHDETATAPTSADYIGRTVRVVVPVAPSGVGKVRLDLKGTTVDVLAVTDEGDAFAAEDEAMIIEMDGTRARIARVNGGDRSRSSRGEE